MEPLTHLHFASPVGGSRVAKPRARKSDNAAWRRILTTPPQCLGRRSRRGAEGKVAKRRTEPRMCRTIYIHSKCMISMGVGRQSGVTGESVEPSAFGPLAGVGEMRSIGHPHGEPQLLYKVGPGAQGLHPRASTLISGMQGTKSQEARLEACGCPPRGWTPLIRRASAVPLPRSAKCNAITE